MIRYKFLFWGLILLPFFSFTQQLSLEIFSSGFSSPVDITHAGDTRLFVVEQDGIIKIADSSGTVTPTPFMNISSLVRSTGNEQGLLGLAFHPNFKTNGYFFVNYTNNSGNTTVSRFSVSLQDSNLADLNSEEIILEVDQPYSNHNGGCLKFGPDGFLYIGLGDGGWADDPGNRAQNPLEKLGKMLRIDIDNGLPYSIPQSNPFVGSANTLEEIWAIGLRNPWRYSFDRHTGNLWIGDVGQDNWEEIDYQSSNSSGGENYGWKCYEGTHPFETQGCGPLPSFVNPVWDYANNNNNGCSVTGGYVYRGSLYQGIYGKYIFADFCSGKIWSISPDTMGGWATTLELEGDSYEYSSFGEDINGELYISGLDGGTIWRIRDTTCTPNALISSNDSIQLCPGNFIEAQGGTGLSYQWVLNGNILQDDTLKTLLSSSNGSYSVIVTKDGCSDESDPVYVSHVTAPQIEILDFPASICYHPDDSMDNLVLNGNPAGGAFSGPGVTGNTFSPFGLQGEQIIEYQYSFGEFCDVSITKEIEVSICTDISPEELEKEFLIIPNFSSSIITIEILKPTPSIAYWTVNDLNGKSIKKGTIDLLLKRKKVSVEGLSKGIYLFQLATDQGLYTKKLLRY